MGLCALWYMGNSNAHRNRLYPACHTPYECVSPQDQLNYAHSISAEAGGGHGEAADYYSLASSLLLLLLRLDSGAHCHILACWLHLILPYSVARSRSRLLGCAGLLSILIILLTCSRTAHLLLRARLLDHPVEDKVVFVAHSIEQVLEQLAQVANIRFLLELQASTVVKIDTKLVWQVLSECLNRGGQLFVTNFFVFFLLCASWQALPRQGALVKIHEDETKRLQVVPPTLLDAQMCVD